jgi:hypothetical protein
MILQRLRGAPWRKVAGVVGASGRCSGSLVGGVRSCGSASASASGNARASASASAWGLGEARVLVRRRAKTRRRRCWRRNCILLGLGMVDECAVGWRYGRWR